MLSLKKEAAVKAGNGRVVPRAMLGLRERVAAWREDKRGRRMPEELWAEAIALAGKYGVHPVSKNVEVSYPRLKKLVETGKQMPPTVSPKFVEVAPVSVIGRSEVRIEIRRPDGSELAIENIDTGFASEVAAGFLGRVVRR